MADPAHPNGSDYVAATGEAATVVSDSSWERVHPWWDLARVVGVVLAAVVVVGMIGRLGDVIGLVLLAAAIALLTDPLRRRLARRLPAGAAIALTALLTLAVIGTLGVLLFRDISEQADRVSTELVDRIRALRPGTLPSGVAESLDAVDGIESGFDQLPAVVVTGEGDVTGVGRRAIDMLLVVILAAFFQSGARAALDRVVALWPRRARKEVREAIADVEARGGGYVRRTMVLGAFGAAVVAGASWMAHVPGAAVLGAWAGLCLTVPAIGWLLGLAPVVAAGFAEDPRTGVLMLVVAGAVAVLAARARGRLVERCRVRPGPALSALSFAVGFVAAGFGGVVVAFVATGLAVAAITSAHQVPSPGPLDGEQPRPAGVRAILRPTDDGIRVAPGWRGALALIAAASAGMLVWMFAGRVGHVAIWLVVGGLIAVALARPVAWLQRRVRLPRPAAVGVVFALAMGVGAAAVLAGIDGGASTSSELAEELPSIVADLESAPVVGSWLEDRDAALWVSQQMTNLPQRLEEARDVAAWLPTIGARLFDLFWTVVLALALLLDGPRLVAGLERRIPARNRRQFARLVDVSRRAVGGYLAGAALVAAINASVVFLIAVAIGVALAPVLAVWAFIWNFVPQIGGFMGGFPLVVLALAVGPMQAVVAGLLFITYQFVENHLIQPTVIGEAIDVPPWATLLAALAGGAAAGVIGAVVLTPLVGVVRVVLLDRRRPDFPGATVPAVSAGEDAVADAGAGDPRHRGATASAVARA